MAQSSTVPSERARCARQSETSVDDPGSRQAPVIFPSGQMTAAELERDRGVDREPARNPGPPAGKIDLRAGRSRIVGEGHAERAAGFLGRHAERQRPSIGIVGSAIGGPAQADRGGDASGAGSHQPIFDRFPSARKSCDGSDRNRQARRPGFCFVGPQIRSIFAPLGSGPGAAGRGSPVCKLRWANKLWSSCKLGQRWQVAALAG